MTSSIYQLYGELWADDDPDGEARIQASLTPRGPDWCRDVLNHVDMLDKLCPTVYVLKKQSA